MDDKIQELFGVNRRETVKIAVADDAQAIHNASDQHFVNAIPVNCAVHLVYGTSLDSFYRYASLFVSIHYYFSCCSTAMSRNVNWHA